MVVKGASPPVAEFVEFVEFVEGVEGIEPAVDHLTSCCAGMCSDPRRLRFNLRIGLTEAISNAVLYGGSRGDKRVRVELRAVPGEIRVRVADSGQGFDPDTVPDPRLPANIAKPSGRGIFLMRALMDEVSYDEEGNSVTLVLRDPSSAAASGAEPSVASSSEPSTAPSSEPSAAFSAAETDEASPLPRLPEAAVATLEDFRSALEMDVRAWQVGELHRQLVVSPLESEGPFRPSESFQVEVAEGSVLEVEVACRDGRSRSVGLLAATLRRTCELARVAEDQMSREMQLAHDLQLKLIPPIPSVAGMEASARVVPNASVGGDFYQVLALSEGRIGVMIGDVSGHGLSAALIMAHAISAAAISAEGGARPATVLERIHNAIGDELESTEMFVTLFYGVLSPEEPELVYSNAGHPHAFLIPGAGSPQRLGATDPPMGIAPVPFAEAEAPWRSGEDLLLLFTDGLSDTLASRRRRNGEARVVSMAAQHRDQPPERVLERLFGMRAPARSLLADDRTALLVRTARLDGGDRSPSQADAA